MIKKTKIREEKMFSGNKKGTLNKRGSAMKYSLVILLLIIAGLFVYYKLVIDRNFDVAITGYSIKVDFLNETLSECAGKSTNLSASLESCQEREATKVGEIAGLGKNIFNLVSEKNELTQNLISTRKELGSAKSRIKGLELDLNETMEELEQVKEEKLNCTVNLRDCNDELDDCLTS